MATWQEFEQQAPELAHAIEARFRAHRHHLMATLRRDGAPRLSGTEVVFLDGALWLGSMPGSVKVHDLRRDPRVALHSAPVDVEMHGGDAKVAGRAIEVTDPEGIASFMAHLADVHGSPPPGEAVLFRIALEDASLVQVEGDHLVIDSWRAGEAPRRRTRS